MSQFTNVKYQQPTNQQKNNQLRVLKPLMNAKINQALKVNKVGNNQNALMLNAMKKVNHQEAVKKDPALALIYNQIFDVFASYFEINKIKQADIDSMSEQQLREYADQLLLRNEELQAYLSRLEYWVARFASKAPAGKPSFLNFLHQDSDSIKNSSRTSKNEKSATEKSSTKKTSKPRQVLLSPAKTPTPAKKQILLSPIKTQTIKKEPILTKQSTVKIISSTTPVAKPLVKSSVKITPIKKIVKKASSVNKSTPAKKPVAKKTMPAKKSNKK